MAVSRAERLYATSLVTADAIVRALLSGSLDHISLYWLSDLDNLSSFETTIKSPARAYVSADEALVDQARARCPVGKDAFAPGIADAPPARGKRMPDVAALSGFIERSAALAGETLEVEDTGQVAESSIFEPEPKKHR